VSTFRGHDQVLRIINYRISIIPLQFNLEEEIMKLIVVQKNQIISILKFFQSFFLIITLVIGCDKETVTEPKEEPPTLPPIETFVMEYSDFQNSGSMTKSAQNQMILSKNNWGWSALNVAVWNTIITVGLAVPVAAYVNSFSDDTPERQEDGTWVWTKNYKILNVNYTAELQGKMDGDGVEWKMYISQENGSQEFLWFTGVSDHLAKEGSWVLYNNPNDPTFLLHIEWHRNYQEETADIKYINIVPDGPENGGYIYYSITKEAPYNAFYGIYNKGKNNHTNIEWSRTTKEGRVKDSLHFGDTDWHLWDSNLEDK
jgi:hypothetical protein